MIRAMLRVGLTGNIACGKSYVTRVLAELGAYIIDADAIVHELLAPQTATHRKIVEVFGPSVLDRDGGIHRKSLAAIIFADAGKRTLLNSIVHPAVGQEIRRRVDAIEQARLAGIVVVDAALMVETGSYRGYDRLVVVTCAPELQLRRLMDRDGLTEGEARARMAAQMPSSEKVKVAHYIIDTSGSFEATGARVEAVYLSLLADAAGADRGSGQPGNGTA